jgi:hypothetical protein
VASWNSSIVRSNERSSDMSGIIGHTMYAVQAADKLLAGHPSVAAMLKRQWSSYLCGAYLGCDIQTLPEAVCVDTGEEVGYGTVPLTKSPLTGGEVKPWVLKHEGREYRPRDIHKRFYGRAHLVFGWNVADRKHTVPWDHLGDYAALTFQDANELYPAGESKLAYLFGWLVHIVGDSLIKSVQPGLKMKLLDGLYTPRNRPVQDLVTYHEIGRKELGLDWPELLSDVAATRVEPVQLHAMRVTRPRGALAASFTNAWSWADEELMTLVCQENRRYLKTYVERLLPTYELTRVGAERKCDAELSRRTGGLQYSEMVHAAQQAGLRDTLNQIADEAVSLFDQVISRVPALAGKNR